MRFLVHGSIAYDLLLSYDGSFVDGIDPTSLEKLSVSYFMPHLKRHHGGTGANIAWNLALLGHTPMLVGAVGADGVEYIDLLKKRGVDTSLVTIDSKAATATAIIGTDDGERQIAFFHPGADAGSTPGKPAKKDIAYAVIGARDPVAMLRGAADSRAAKIPYLFDPGQQTHAFSRDEFRRAVSESAGLVVNEYEWSLASEKLGWKEDEVVDACGLLVVTLGEKGIRLRSSSDVVTVPACRIAKLVNPTGAGDAVRAGLLVGLASKWTLEKCGQLACALASFVVGQEGTLLDRLDQKTLQKRTEENYGAL